MKMVSPQISRVYFCAIEKAAECETGLAPRGDEGAFQRCPAGGVHLRDIEGDGCMRIPHSVIIVAHGWLPIPKESVQDAGSKTGTVAQAQIHTDAVFRTRDQRA